MEGLQMTRKTGKVSLVSTFTILFASLTSTPLWAGLETKVIYGADNRLDLYQVNDSKKLELADATVALFQKSDLVLSNKKYTFSLDKFGESASLCSNEPFFDQPSVAFCSGALVAPNIIITAGHCIEDESECANTKFGFNYSVKSNGQFPTALDARDVVGCKSIIHRERVDTGADFAVIELTRRITHHKPLAINRANDLKVGDSIGVIGHPSGLPTKVAYGASVRSLKAGFFMTNLDTFGGNSGSAVFNETTGLIEGILVRGEKDFAFDFENSCRRSNVCSETGCRGEDVTLISQAAPFIPVSE